jgi:hypothetical protein
MIPSHIEKLKRDSRELEHFIQKMRKRGRSDVAGRLKAKKASIDSFVEQYTEESKQSYLVA